MLILFACKFYLQVLGEKNMEMYLHVSWTWSIITIYSGKDKCQIYPSTWNIVPGPKTLDMKQRRLVFPREAKKGRTASVPAYSLKKDPRPWYRKKNPGRARQRKWRSESRVARASIAHRVEDGEWRQLHWEENSKICRRPPSNIPLSPDEQMKVQKLPKRIPGNSARNSACFPEPENFINHGWWTTAGVGKPRGQTKSSPTLTFVNNIFLKYSHTHFFMYLLWLLSCYNDGLE